jgi:hypothetical protein
VKGLPVMARVTFVVVAIFAILAMGVVLTGPWRSVPPMPNAPVAWQPPKTAMPFDEQLKRRNEEWDRMTKAEKDRFINDLSQGSMLLRNLPYPWMNPTVDYNLNIIPMTEWEKQHLKLIITPMTEWEKRHLK